jgi:hypothetical protein
MRSPLIILMFLALVVFSYSTSVGQIEAQVTVNMEKIPGSARDLLQNFGSDIQTYINSNKWTSDDLGNEKIQCSITIFFVSVNGDNSYSAQFFLGSQRPVYKSQKNTAMLRIFDDTWNFVYVKNQPLYKDETRFDPLTSFINFYMFLVLGYDFDSYNPPLSGTPYFQKAVTICSQAPPSIKGWDRSASTYSKFSFVEELLNAKYRSIREGMFSYHFKGIDYLASKPAEGQKNIIAFLQKVADFRKSVNPRSLVVKAFFDTKYQELAEIFRDYQDKSVLLLLCTIDPAHESTYRDLKK